MKRRELNWPLRQRRLRESSQVWILLLPVIVFFAVFQYYPILKSILISFREYGLLLSDRPWIGFGNYTRQFRDPLFLSALFNTIRFVCVVVLVGVGLALFIAVLVEKTGRWKGFYRTLYFIPVVTSLLAASMVWRWLYAPDGLFNTVADWFGAAPTVWLLDESLALPSLMILTIWKNLGFDLVLFSAAIQAVPGTYYEASRMDGASAWQDFRFITLPQLRPVLLLVIVTAVIRSFQVFTIVIAMTQGGPLDSTRTVVYHIYEQGVQYDDVGYASAAGVLLLLIIAGLTWIQMTVAKEK